ncbi:uncharacterized protein LOC124775825 [Schistocerca piceifrons]|uniref:uncharacterized protein LOC124775825 n=1 Tax=Schistocerca piceifrons TaxID=274613 RepID=UPI001F5F160A|nr:uncharacterized protein LOC124775825 [Schistocerca piceifrons]XP_047106616.1 uncharacterized protein LOC124775825 [Schistocerca piceifrons]
MAADERAARREARRRRILENSENRLQRITGRYESGSDAKAEYSTTGEEATTWKSSIQKDAINGLIRPVKIQQKTEEHYESAGSKYADEILRRVQNCNIPCSRLDSPIDETSNEATTGVKAVEQRTHRSRFFVWNLHFVCTAVITRTLFAFGLGYLFSELVFLPLLLLLLSEILLAKTVNSSSTYGILGGALILIGLPSHLVTTCAYCVSVASHLIGVFAIYLVSFTLTDCVINSVSSADSG